MPHTHKIAKLKTQLNACILGQEKLIDMVLIGIFAQGHILLESVPGLAKTTLAKALAKSLELSFKRIQFTPDLLPSDIIGAQIYSPKDSDLHTRFGAIFTHILLADEINRAPAKVQSALLEAMQEHQVTIGEDSYLLPSPFIVIATANPIESEGVYALPEAQLDRFMLAIPLSYPDSASEIAILQGKHHAHALAERFFAQRFAHLFKQFFVPCASGGHRRGKARRLHRLVEHELGLRLLVQAVGTVRDHDFGHAHALHALEVPHILARAKRSFFFQGELADYVCMF